MRDKLEEFISKNRAGLDDKIPSEKVWNGIDRSLVTTTNRRLWVWRTAAAVFFVISLFLLGDKLSTHKSAKELLAERAESIEDFKSVEAYYFDKISEKRKLIYASTENRAVPLNVAFEQDLQKLDAMYQVLKEEAEENPSKEVIDALILNLLVRIDILNEELEEIEKEEQKITV